MSTSSYPPQKVSPWRRLWPTLVIVIAVIVLGLIWLMWAAFPKLPRNILAGGRNAANPVASGSQSNVELTIEKGMTSSRGVTNGSDFLPCQTVAIYCDTPSLLNQRIAQSLFEALNTSQRFASIRLVPPGQILPRGELLPDLCLTVTESSFETGGVNPLITFKGVHTLSFGDLPQRSHTSVTDTFSPPIAQFYGVINCRYSGTQQGVELAAARFTTLGRDIATSFEASLYGALDEMQKQSQPGVIIPEEAIPEYEPTPEVIASALKDAETLMSGRRPFTRNRTMWKLANGIDKAPRQELAASLTQEGWFVEPESDLRFYASNRRGETLEIYALQIMPGDVALTVMFADYGKRLDEEQIKARLSSLLAREPNEGELLAFQRWWPAQQEAISAYFIKHPPQNVHSLVSTIQNMRERGDTENARAALLRVDALERIRHSTNQPTELISKLAKEMEIALPTLPSLEHFIPGDVIDLRNAQSAQAEAQVNETIIILLEASDTSQRILCLTPASDMLRPDKLTLKTQYLQASVGGASWSTNSHEIDFASGKATAIPLHDGSGILSTTCTTDQVTGRYILTFQK